MKPEPISDSSALDDINYKISSFLKSFTLVLYVIMGMSVAGVMMKLFAMKGGSYVFVVSMSILTLLFLVQIGLSFFYVVTQVRLALLGAFSSLALALGYLSIIFRYQDWYGWQILFLIVIPVFLLTVIYLVLLLLRKRKMKPQYRTFLLQNLLVPYCLLVAMLILSFLVEKEKFLYRSRYLREGKPATEVVLPVNRFETGRV